MADAPEAGDEAGGEERQTLLHFLEYQRASVLSIVEHLDERAWHTSVVPSGWTPAGLVEHLGGAERHWFQQVVAGAEDYLPWDEGRPPYDPEAAFTCDRPAADVLAYYREQCKRSDAVLVATPLSARRRPGRKRTGHHHLPGALTGTRVLFGFRTHTGILVRWPI